MAHGPRATWGPPKHPATKQEDELGPEPFLPLTSSPGEDGPDPALEFGAFLLSHSVGKSEEHEADRGVESCYRKGCWEPGK